MLSSEPNDDPGFLQLATALILGSIESTPARICLVKIDNWFDAKWLGFVGKCMGALGVGYPQDLRIPPFHPHRVLGQWDLVWDESSDDYRPSEQPALHIYQTSESNFQRHARVVLGRSARLVWFSGNSLANGRGSLMVYDLREEVEEPWYVELTRGQPWQFGRCRGVSRGQLSRILEEAQRVRH